MDRMPEGAIEISGDMRQVISNIAKNSKLHEIDQAVQQGHEPEVQLAILMLAIAKCFGRLRRKHNLTGARRKHVLKFALKEFESKVRQFGFEDEPAKT